MMSEIPQFLMAAGTVVKSPAHCREVAKREFTFLLQASTKKAITE
jgi:hypothetical protein